MIIVVAHQCIHRQFSRNASRDEAIGEFVTVLTVFQDLGAFKREHIASHHQPAIFASREDPPVQLLDGLGLRAGMSRAQLWRRAWFVFLTPGFYVNGAWSRLRGNLVAGHPIRRVGFIVWTGMWLSVAFWAPNGLAILLVAFVFPILPVAQLSALLDKMGEHAWLTPPDPAHGRRHHHVSASWARFCGDPVPASGQSAAKAVAAWTRWLLRAFFYHLPSRLFVVVGDLPNHDYHHRYPGSPDWPTAAYGRQRDVEAGNGPPYVEVWGLGAAIDRSFASLAAHESRSGTPRGKDARALASHA
jgi:fatty acid desaturase